MNEFWLRCEHDSQGAFYCKAFLSVLCGIVRKDKSKALKAFQGIVSFQREGVSGCKPP